MHLKIKELKVPHIEEGKFSTSRLQQKNYFA
jgi:hypothetical protein